MSTGFGPSKVGLGHSNPPYPITPTSLTQPTSTSSIFNQKHPVFTSSSQPASTSSISKEKYPITKIEGSKAILAGLQKIEQIVVDWRQNLRKFGITEDLETEKNYVKNIKMCIDLVEENLKKKAHKNRAKLQSVLDKIGSFVTGG